MLGMAEKTKLEKLAEDLVTPDREFPPRTPHTYAHTGAQILRRFHLLPDHQPDDPLGTNVVNLYPDAPEAAIYYFPSREREV